MPQMRFSLFLFIEGGGCRWGVFFWRVTLWASLFLPLVHPFLSSHQIVLNGTFAQQILMQIQALFLWFLFSFHTQTEVFSHNLTVFVLEHNFLQYLISVSPKWFCNAFSLTYILTPRNVVILQQISLAIKTIFVSVLKGMLSQYIQMQLSLVSL